MAQNYVPPAFLAAEMFLTEFVGESSARDGMGAPRTSYLAAMLNLAIVEHGNPEPSCLMDLVLLWLTAQGTPDHSDLDIFSVCTTYETYLQSMMCIIDVWQRMPERFTWAPEIALEYGLAPITRVFPDLPDAEVPRSQSEPAAIPPDAPTGEPRQYLRGSLIADIMLAQYDHPAIRRETFDYWRSRRDYIYGR